MIEMTSEDIERIWDSMSHFIPEKQKLDAAIDFVKTLEGMGVEESEIKAIGEFSPKLEEAVVTVFENDEEEQYDDRYDD
jgi:thiamine pyrophosphate-dependent acetolactate synthase large subunit-like protein|tara:strand:- start:4220 stop:4456 length:237 start_codon:yes stop_codon:yes gene_type:complete